MAHVTDISDPREFPQVAEVGQAPLFALAEESLAAESGARADELDRALTEALAALLRAGDGAGHAALFAAAPSAAVARHLWRHSIEAWAEVSRGSAADAIVATVFALPVVIVAGSEPAGPAVTLPGVLANTRLLAAILREHNALAGNQAFGLANVLVAADALDVGRLPELLAWQRLPDAARLTAARERAPEPAPIEITPGRESVHLRFLVGTALASRLANPLAGASVGAWGIPMAQELARELAAPGVSLLVLPRSPQTPLAALAQGRAAQREVGAQIFASNAIRRLRASVGEPAAVISAHRCRSAMGGGELRLSLSSSFDPRRAEGFRCPLYPTERAADVATMLIDLLRDCRVTDIRVLCGVHADCDPATGVTLLYKADAIPDIDRTVYH